MLQSWAAGLIPKLTLPTPSHSSPSHSLLLNVGRARLLTDAHTGFSAGVAVPQHHVNITTTAWAGSGNSHPKDNVSGPPKKQKQGRKSGAPARDMVTDTQSFHAQSGDTPDGGLQPVGCCESFLCEGFQRMVNKGFYFSAANTEPRQS